MITFCRYACAVVVLTVATLTPSSCSDFDDPALAAQGEMQAAEHAVGRSTLKFVDEASDRDAEQGIDLSGS